MARAWLGGNWSAEVTLKQGHELVRDGPYALVRHPIYTGVLVALIGTAVAVGNGRAIIGLALVAAGFVRKLVIEERFMSEQFGDDLCALPRRSARAHSVRALSALADDENAGRLLVEIVEEIIAAGFERAQADNPLAVSGHDFFDTQAHAFEFHRRRVEIL